MMELITVPLAAVYFFSIVVRFGVGFFVGFMLSEMLNGDSGEPIRGENLSFGHQVGLVVLALLLMGFLVYGIFTLPGS